MASNYFELFSKIWGAVSVEWKNNGPTKNFLQDFIKECSQYGVIRKEDLALTFILAVIFTVLRYVVTAFVFKPLANYFQFIPKDKKKFPESAWKLLYYLSMYSFCTYTLFNGKHPFLENPSSVWTGWSRGATIPKDMYIIYVIQAGFYFHSIYGTIYMDKWRRDSIVMILHHVLANSLIIFSFAMRYHNIGIIVLFLHDISDIFLESSKITLCFKSAPGKYQHVAGILVNVGFLSFASSWFYCRLYQYPYRVLYVTGYVSRIAIPNAPFYFFFNGMLWILFAMNIWWFHFVVWLIWRVLNGESREIEDPREISKTEKPSTKKSHNANGDLMKNGINGKNVINTSENKIINDELKNKEEEKNKIDNGKPLPHQRRKKNFQGN